MFAALLSFAFAGPLPAELRDVSVHVEELRAQHGVPALGAALIVGDELAAIGVAGVRRAGHEARVTVDDRWHLGSCTKAMTATLAAEALDEGLLALETTLGTMFADEAGGLLPPLTGTMNDAWRAVTLEQLLGHTSGAPSGLSKNPGLALLVQALSKEPERQRRELVTGLLVAAPATTPGSGYVYSNEGYVLAGAMIERVREASWEETIARRLFAPLGMASAGFGPPGSAAADEAPDEPEGHTPAGKPVGRGTRADNPAAYGPAGTVHASLADWAKFVSLHLAAERRVREGAGDASLAPVALKAGTLARFHEAAALGDYARGWVVAERPWAKGTRADDRGRVLTHGGSNTLWFCVAWLAPERDFAAIAVCNQGTEAAAQACDAAVAALLVRQAQALDEAAK